MAQWQKIRKILLDQGVTGDEIAAALEAVDNRTRTMKDLDKRASLEAMYDNTLDRLRRDERYADRTDEEIERAAGQYFRNTVKMSATPRGRALLTRLGTLEATEFAMDYATIEAAADAAGVEAEVIETQTRPMREASPEDVAAGRPVPPSPSFAGIKRRGILSATPTATWAGETFPVGRFDTRSPDPATRTLMTRGEPVFGPAASVLAERQAEQARRRGVEAAGGRNRSRGDREVMPILDPWETGDALDQMMAEEAAGGRTPYDEELAATPGWAGDRGLTDTEKLASMREDQPWPSVERPARRTGDWMIHPRTGELVPADSLDALDQLEALEADTQNTEDVLGGRAWKMEQAFDDRLRATPGLAGDRGLSEEEYFAKRQAEQPWPDLDSLADGPVNTGRSMMETGPIEIADRSPEGAPSGDEPALPEPSAAIDQLDALRPDDYPAPAAGGPAAMVKQAQADNAAASKDNAAAQQATQPPSPGKGYSNSEIAGMVVGGAGLAAAIGNTIADFRTTRGLERQLAASAAGDTIARREGALAGSQAQRNIMATSMGRRDISPALALRNAQMTGSRAMSDIYGRAAVESARERRQAEAQLAHMRKKRWNTLFSGLTQTGATVGSFLTAEGAAQTGAAKRGAGGGNGGR